MLMINMSHFDHLQEIHVRASSNTGSRKKFIIVYQRMKGFSITVQSTTDIFHQRFCNKITI